MVDLHRDLRFEVGDLTAGGLQPKAFPLQVLQVSGPVEPGQRHLERRRTIPESAVARVLAGVQPQGQVGATGPTRGLEAGLGLRVQPSGQPQPRLHGQGLSRPTVLIGDGLGASGQFPHSGRMIHTLAQDAVHTDFHVAGLEPLEPQTGLGLGNLIAEPDQGRGRDRAGRLSCLQACGDPAQPFEVGLGQFDLAVQQSGLQQPFHQVPFEDLETGLPRLPGGDALRARDGPRRRFLAEHRQRLGDAQGDVALFRRRRAPVRVPDPARPQGGVRPETDPFGVLAGRIGLELEGLDARVSSRERFGQSLDGRGRDHLGPEGQRRHEGDGHDPGPEMGPSWGTRELHG